VLRIRRFLRALVRAVMFVLRGLFILLLLVIPIPLAWNPRRVVLPPNRRNLPTEVLRKEEEK
jgi:hypothetical protein